MRARSPIHEPASPGRRSIWRWNRARLALITFSICLLAAASTGLAQPFVATNLLRPDFWDTDGTIHTVAATNGVVYVGGDFSYVAPKGRKAAAVDAYTAEPILDFPEISGRSVNVILSDENGGWWVGGNFTAVGGFPITNLVHLTSTFGVDPDFDPNPDGTVHALQAAGGLLYLGGEFTNVANQPRKRLAALNAVTGVPAPWNPGASSTVWVMALEGSTLYVGGSFTTIDNRPQKRLAAFALEQGAAFMPNFAPQDLDGDVLALAWLDNRLFIGGNFNQVGGTSTRRNGLAAVDAITGAVLNWDPNPIGSPGGGKTTSLRVLCNTVYVGGHFTNIAGLERHRVAALDAYTGTNTPWNPQLGLFRSGIAPSSIKTMEISGNTLYLGGNFNSAAGQSRTDLVAVDVNTGELLAWNPHLDGGINTLAVAGRTLLAGLVHGTGGKERQNLAAFDEITGRALDWNPGADNTVRTLLLSGNTVYAGGDFTSVGGEPHRRLAAIDAASGQVITSWTAEADDTVHVLASSGGSLFAGGDFTLMALSLASGQRQPGWSSDVEGTVYTLATSSDTLFVGGDFSSINLLFSPRLAALNIANGNVKTWLGSLDDFATARTMALSGNILYVGGDFSAANGQPRSNLAAFAANSGEVLPWAPAIKEGSVLKLLLAGEQFIVAGTFQSVGLQSRHGLAALSANGDVLGWNPSASVLNQILALALSEHALFVAGQALAFQQADSGQSLAVFPPPGAPRLLGIPNSFRAPIGGTAAFIVQAEGLEPLFFRWQLDGTNIAGATNSTLLLTDLSVAQSGRYALIASNALGFATAEAVLLVLAPVHIDAQPASQTVAPGTTITLSVNATGSPPPIYQWRRNGVNIPGAVYPTLTLSNASPSSGGTYSVAIANSSGVLYSAEVRVVVTSPALPFANNFTERGVINTVSGIGSGNNTAYTKELLEAGHAGKPGGKSAWLEWIAPTNGIVTFSTLGSGFDTLLAIYTNDTIATLGSVTSDDDRGGFLASRAAFNAVRGAHYQIAIDGLGDESGDIVLGWQMEVNAPELPLITAQPVPQSVTNGSPVIFSVGTLASSALAYQWYFGCQELRGATNDTLVLASAQLRQVGFYRVVVTSASGRSSESLPAALEIGPIPSARSYNKLADLLDALAGNGSGGGGGFRPAATGITTPFLLSIGIPKSFKFPTDGSGTYSTVTDCGLIVGPGAWLYFTQSVDGLVVMDTIGSSFNTLLTIFNNTNLSALPANVVACNDDGAPDNVRSLLRFFGTNKHQYIALVTGVAGAYGSAQINWRIVFPPLIVTSNSQLTARLGGSLTLDAGVVATNQEPRFQWYFKGVALMGETNRTLRRSRLSAEQSGSYQVVVGNDAGTVTNTRAIVQITPPPQLESTRWDSLGRFTFQIRGDSNAPFHLETSSNLHSWSLMQTGRLVQAVTTFTDTNSRTPPRFYRVVEPAGPGP